MDDHLAWNQLGRLCLSSLEDVKKGSGEENIGTS